MPATPTLQQINDAITAVNAALGDDDITPTMQTTLGKLSNVLQVIQNTVIENNEDTLVNELAANNDDLQALNKQINDLSAGLDSASDTINTVSTTVGTVAAIIGALI